MFEGLAAAWAEWSTYRPSDFLMFAPRTYWRLFELHNQSLGPAIWLVWAAGLAALWGMLLGIRRPKVPLRTMVSLLAAGLALAWAAVGWFFLHQRYATIFWIMNGVAWAFMVQALLLALMAVATWRSMVLVVPTPAARNGCLLLVGWAVLVQPLLAVLAGRPWLQAEVSGLAPDPTVFATLGLLLCMATPHGTKRWLFEAMWVLALAWCAFSAATLWTMGSAQGTVPFLMGLGALAWRQRRGSRLGRARTVRVS